MSTDIRPNVSKRKSYWISKHRFYELKHFCLQYYEWKKAYIDALSLKSKSIVTINKNRIFSDSVETADFYYNRMKLLEDTAKLTDPCIGNYIFKAVTEDRTFVYLDAVMGIPCSRGMYYDRYRKFFYLLHLELEKREKQFL